jgi:hypothetical protein
MIAGAAGGARPQARGHSPIGARARSPEQPPIGANDAHAALGTGVTKPQLRGSKHAIDNQVVAAHAVID